MSLARVARAASAALRARGAVLAARPAAADPARAWSSVTGPSEPPQGELDEAERRKTVQRLLYRSRQRGFLELDLLVGMWAEEHARDMGVAELAELSTVLDQENPDLFGWLTGQNPPPPELAANSVYGRLRSHVSQAMDKMPEAVRAAKGAAWVRGWEDNSRGDLSPTDGTSS